MGDSQQGNNKRKDQEEENYKSWTMDDTNVWLHLLVEAMNNGLRDANWLLSKKKCRKSYIFLFEC